MREQQIYIRLVFRCWASQCYQYLCIIFHLSFFLSYRLLTKSQPMTQIGGIRALRIAASHKQQTTQQVSREARFFPNHNCLSLPGRRRNEVEEKTHELHCIKFGILASSIFCMSSVPCVLIGCTASKLYLVILQNLNVRNPFLNSAIANCSKQIGNFHLTQNK